MVMMVMVMMVMAVVMMEVVVMVVVVMIVMMVMVVIRWLVPALRFKCRYQVQLDSLDSADPSTQGAPAPRPMRQAGRKHQPVPMAFAISASSPRVLLGPHTHLNLSNSDILTIYDGDEVTPHILGQYLGSSGPQKLYSSTPDLTIQFHSDPAGLIFGKGQGFIMNYIEVSRNDSCSDLPEIQNGWKTTSHTELVRGAKITYQCDPGYDIVGSDTLTCQWDLSWSSDPPFCEKIMYCTDPGEVDHSTRLISDPVLLVGTTIQYTCNPGFVLEGSSLLTCYSRQTGTPIWTSRLPHCVSEETLACDNPGLPENGYQILYKRLYLPGESLTFMCYEGFELMGEVTIRCILGQPSHWNGPLPVCKVNQDSFEHALEVAEAAAETSLEGGNMALAIFIPVLIISLLLGGAYIYITRCRYYSNLRLPLMYSHPYSQITVETEFDNPIYETGLSLFTYCYSESQQQQKNQNHSLKATTVDLLINLRGSLRKPESMKFPSKESYTGEGNWQIRTQLQPPREIHPEIMWHLIETPEYSLLKITVFFTVFIIFKIEIGVVGCSEVQVTTSVLKAGGKPEKWQTAAEGKKYAMLWLHHLHAPSGPMPMEIQSHLPMGNTDSQQPGWATPPTELGGLAIGWEAPRPEIQASCFTPGVLKCLSPPNKLCPNVERQYECCPERGRETEGRLKPQWNLHHRIQTLMSRGRISGQKGVHCPSLSWKPSYVIRILSSQPSGQGSKVSKQEKIFLPPGTGRIAAMFVGGLVWGALQGGKQLTLHMSMFSSQPETWKLHLEICESCIDKNPRRNTPDPRKESGFIMETVEEEVMWQNAHSGKVLEAFGECLEQDRSEEPILSRHATSPQLTQAARMRCHREAACLPGLEAALPTDRLFIVAPWGYRIWWGVEGGLGGRETSVSDISVSLPLLLSPHSYQIRNSTRHSSRSMHPPHRTQEVSGQGVQQTLYVNPPQQDFRETGSWPAGHRYQLCNETALGSRLVSDALVCPARELGVPGSAPPPMHSGPLGCRLNSARLKAARLGVFRQAALCGAEALAVTAPGPSRSARSSGGQTHPAPWPVGEHELVLTERTEGPGEAVT
ncbi:Seizure 6-like protein, partial [Galemys pyrenaicus]